MNIGLRRGVVRLAPHSGEWATAFEVEKVRLAKLLGEAVLAIEHVGSTAVPALDSKPIIDIAIAVESWDRIADWSALLAREGYACFGDRENTGDHFFSKGPEQLRTHHVHVVIAGGAKWIEYIKFRDALRTSPALRDEYRLLKRDLAARFPNDRESYTDSKEPFIKRILAV